MHHPTKDSKYQPPLAPSASLDVRSRTPTPGPWKVEAGDVVTSESGGVIAYVYGYGASREEVAVNEEANAALISAAPDLLELAHAVLESRHLRELDLEAHLHTTLAPLAHAAVAKAEGRAA